MTTIIIPIHQRRRKKKKKDKKPMGRRRKCWMMPVLALCAINLGILQILQASVEWGDPPLALDHLIPQRFMDLAGRSTNKTLVIIIGNLRGGELAWKTLYENVLDVNQADLALMIGRSTDHSSSLYDRARFLWEIEEYSDWSKGMDLMDPSGGWRNRVPHVLHPRSSILGPWKTYRGSGLVIFMFRYFLTQEIKRHARKLTSYDRFVITRSDHFYSCPHNLTELDPQYLWIPEGEDWGGVTDRHLVVNASMLLPALDMLPDLIANPKTYLWARNSPNANPEQFIAYRWKMLGIYRFVRKFPRVMFTCATATDTTRWQQRSDEMVPEGVYLKYKDEYTRSLKTCRHQNSN